MLAGAMNGMPTQIDTFHDLFPSDGYRWRDDTTSGEIARDHIEEAERKARAQLLLVVLAMETRLFPPKKLADLIDVSVPTLYRRRNEMRESGEGAAIELRQRLGLN